MADSLRNTLRIIDDATLAIPENEKNLSIELLPDGFVFSVMDADRFKFLALEDHRIEQSPWEVDPVSHLGYFLTKNPLSGRDYQKVIISYYSPQLILVPSAIYNPDEKEALFSLCSPVPGNHYIWSDRLHVMDGYGVYSIPKDLADFIERMLPGCKIRHYGSGFIENVLASKKLERWNADVVLHIRSTHFEVILIRNNQLEYYHSFPYQKFDDLLYYLFYVLERHKIEAGEQGLMVIGELGMDSPGFEILNGFFREVSFPRRNDMFLYSSVFEDVPHHYYFNLLNLNICG
ncbi:MAG: DUF3822 family protein [Bacteroidales bacterium]